MADILPSSHYSVCWLHEQAHDRLPRCADRMATPTVNCCGCVSFTLELKNGRARLITATRRIDAGTWMMLYFTCESARIIEFSETTRSAQDASSDPATSSVNGARRIAWLLGIRITPALRRKI